MTEGDIRRKRLLYQAGHRGSKEADLLIGGFANSALAAMSDAELDAFEALLAHPDDALVAWIVGDATPPLEVAGPLFEKLCAFRVHQR